MSLELTMHELLSPLATAVYPDTVPTSATFPCISYQQVGGEAGWYVEGTMPDHKHARVQINVWSKRRLEANALARQVEDAICASGLIAQPYGALVATYEEALKLYGTRQDFGIHYPD